jgi:hypothetical protein
MSGSMYFANRARIRSSPLEGRRTTNWPSCISRSTVSPALSPSSRLSCAGTRIRPSEVIRVRCIVMVGVPLTAGLRSLLGCSKPPLIRPAAFRIAGRSSVRELSLSITGQKAGESATNRPNDERRVAAIDHFRWSENLIAPTAQPGAGKFTRNNRRQSPNAQHQDAGQATLALTRLTRAATPF